MVTTKRAEMRASLDASGEPPEGFTGHPTRIARFDVASPADCTNQRRGRSKGLLDGKSAIVTGSARGIGRATAELFASEGAKVLVNDLDDNVAEQTASEIDGETAVFSGDLTKSGAADEMVAAAIDAFGAVDIVVNNAGYT